MSSYYILEQLYVENQNNNLVIFIGSGISKYYSNLPGKFPDWEELIDRFREELNISKNTGNDYLRIAQIFENKYNRNEVIKVLNDIFPENVEPGEFHKILFQIEPVHIITTNYDDLIEKALERSYKKSQYKVLKSDQDFPYTLKHSNFIVKAHGDLKQKNIVLTEKDYINYHKNFPLFLAFLKYVFAKYRVLFIGFSLTDQNFIKILEDVKDVLGDNSIKHVAIMHEDITDEEKMYFDKKSVIIVTRREVEEFLNFEESDKNDNTKYLIEYFKYLYAGYTNKRPLNIFQFLEKLLNVGFLNSFDFIYKDVLNHVWNEQNVKVNYKVIYYDLSSSLKIETISIDGVKISLNDVLMNISESKDVNDALKKLLVRSNIVPDESNLKKLTNLIIDVLNLLLKSNVICVNEYYIPEIIAKLRKSNEMIEEYTKGKPEKNNNERTEFDFLKLMTYIPDGCKDISIKNFTDISISINGNLWKQIFKDENFYIDYLVGKTNKALSKLLQNISEKNLADEKRFLELYRIKHLCRISGYGNKKCLIISKEIKNILENCDKITHAIISYFNDESYISSFKKFVYDFEKLIEESNSREIFFEESFEKSLNESIYIEYSSFLKFIISNKLPVLHYLSVKNLIKFVIDHFFKEIYGNQNEEIIDIPEWIVIGLMFLNFNDARKILREFLWKVKRNNVKLSDRTKEYIREILNKFLSKYLSFDNNFRVVYPENLILFLLQFSCEKSDIELFIEFWDKYIKTIYPNRRTAYEFFNIIGTLIRSTKNEKNINEYLSKYISEYKIIDKYIEIFISNKTLKENYIGFIADNLEMLALRNLKFSCNKKRISELENSFDEIATNLDIKRFLVYLFYVCSVDKTKILKIVNKHFNFNDLDIIKNRFGLIENLIALYNFTKILKVNIESMEQVLEGTIEVLSYEIENYEIDTKIRAMSLLKELVLNENINGVFTDKIEKIVESYLDAYKTYDKFINLFYKASGFWKDLSIVCLFLISRKENSKLKKEIIEFFEEFLDEEKIKYMILVIKNSIHKDEMLKQFRRILCKIDKSKLSDDILWIIYLIYKEK